MQRAGDQTNKRTNGQTVENWLRRHAPIKASGEIPDDAVVGGWRIAALVARGGSGEVYRAVHAETSQVAALKILHRDDDAARARFAREISILSENNSPFFPAFYGAGEYGGRPWYAMEFLEPFTLPSGDGAVASFVTDVCRGAGMLHALGYVHRDIKPANILSRNGEPVLIDLGLAKATGGPAVPLGPAPSIVDGHAVGVGTPGYSAPEQFTGGDISPAADIHAIGVLASECLGEKPPLCWRRIIRRATSSLPSERYRDCASLLLAIRLRHWPRWAAVLAVCVAILVIGASLGARASSPRPDRTLRIAGPARVVFRFRRLSDGAALGIGLAADNGARNGEYSLDSADEGVWYTSAVYAPSGTNDVIFSGAGVELKDVQIITDNLEETRALALAPSVEQARSLGDFDKACMIQGGVCELWQYLTDTYGVPYKRYLADAMVRYSRLLAREPGRLEVALIEADKAIVMLDELAKTDSGTFGPLADEARRSRDELSVLARGAANRRAVREEAERIRRAR